MQRIFLFFPLLFLPSSNYGQEKPSYEETIQYINNKYDFYSNTADRIYSNSQETKTVQSI